MNDIFDVLVNLLPVFDNLVIIGDLNIDISDGRIFYDKPGYLIMQKVLLDTT